MSTLFAIPTLLASLVALIFFLVLIENRKGKASVPTHVLILFGVAVVLSGYAAFDAASAGQPAHPSETADVAVDDADYTFETDGTTVSFMPDGTVVILSRDGTARVTKSTVRTIDRALEEFDAGNLPGKAD